MRTLTSQLAPLPEGKCTMLTARKVEEVRRIMATEAMSYRQIARRLEIGHGTVAKIAAGTCLEIYTRPDEPQPDQSEEHLLGPVERCKGCGGLAEMPCRLCHVREIKARQRTTNRLLREEIRR